MKAVVYQEPNKVEVTDVDDPRIEAPTDVIIKITSTAICGSDLHMYEGRTPAESGTVFGHENRAVRATGLLGVVGLYTTHDPGAPTEEAKRGNLLLAMGRFFEKGMRMGSGQASAKAYNRQLRDLIITGRARPSFVVSKELPLADAPEAYARFDAREEGYSKVVLKPDGAGRS